MTFLHATQYQEVALSREAWTRYRKRCPLCDSGYLIETLQFGYLPYEHEEEVCGRFCPLCGHWELEAIEWGQQDYLEEARLFESRLENFEHLAEASSSLLPAVCQIADRDDLYLMTPRQFEELAYFYIRDRFECQVAMTKTTRDGGYDLVCCDSAAGPFIVEAKRYRKTKVDVALVRQMAGVQLINQIPRAIIVTSGRATRDALREMDRLTTFGQYHLEIHDIDDVMAWLGKIKHGPVKVDIRGILASIHFLQGDPVDHLIYDPVQKELLFR